MIVTDEMVERALSAPYGAYSVSSFIPLKSPHNIRELMRAALGAALAATPTEEPAQGKGWDGVLIDRETLHAALRELVMKIEACGASVALTRASSLACHIMRAIGNRWNPPDPNGQREVNAAIDASRTAAAASTTTEKPE